MIQSESQSSRREAALKALQEENQRLQRAVGELALLNDLAREIGASLNSEEIMQTIIRRSLRAVDAEQGVITLIDQHASTPMKTLVRTRVSSGGQQAFHLEQSLQGWMLLHKKPLLINDPASDERFHGVAWEQSIRSLLCAPLLIKSELKGILTLYNKKGGQEFTAEDQRLLGIIAAQSAQVMENARLYKQLEQYNRTLEEKVQRRTAELQDKNLELTQTLQRLRETQNQLVTQEKLASLGQLTAGIAHEIKNPLNFVNNFAALSIELAQELREEIVRRKAKNVNEDDFTDIEEILSTLEQNAEKINHHGRRADSIVKSMMQHARGSSGQRELADINQLLEEAVNLTYHGLRANEASFNVTIEKKYDSTIGPLSVIPQDLSRVFLNLFNNACYAAHEKKKLHPAGFDPVISVFTKNLGSQIEIRIRDNGNGIPQDIRDKIFNPFFTTKPAGQGAGLGLSISHDIIVQQHRGEIEVETEPGKFTEFVVRLPKDRSVQS